MIDANQSWSAYSSIDNSITPSLKEVKPQTSFDQDMSNKRQITSIGQTIFDTIYSNENILATSQEILMPQTTAIRSFSSETILGKFSEEVQTSLYASHHTSLGSSYLHSDNLPFEKPQQNTTISTTTHAVPLPTLETSFTVHPTNTFKVTSLLGKTISLTTFHFETSTDSTTASKSRLISEIIQTIQIFTRTSSEALFVDEAQSVKLLETRCICIIVKPEPKKQENAREFQEQKKKLVKEIKEKLTVDKTMISKEIYKKVIEINVHKNNVITLSLIVTRGQLVLSILFCSSTFDTNILLF